MKKRKKLDLLQVGERVWIETTGFFYSGKRYIDEYEIVEANKSSAYAVRVEDLEKENPSRKRIEQGTRKVIARYSMGESYYFWETKEKFEQSVKRQAETISMRQKAIEKVKTMNFEQLKEFLVVKDES
ncbi:hypothetical protein [Bacillus badius]|nr:hypothetical protein [Bacillus badius]MED4718274.1 hypothetical protein [Bacillus badius]